MARSRLRRALDEMARYTSGPYRVEFVPPTKWAKWAVRGTFYLPSGTTYDDVLQILEDWAGAGIESIVGPRRTARIVVAYDQGRGRSGEYTLAEISAWSYTVSRAIERVDVRDGDMPSLIERYGRGGEGGTSAITRLYVWFGDDLRDVSGLEF